MTFMVKKASNSAGGKRHNQGCGGNMNRVVRRIAASVALALAVILAVGITAHARGQSPTVLMFYGGDLKAPVFLTDTDAAAFRNLLTETAITVREMGDRPYVSVALFWASRLDPAGNGTAVKDLKPAMAWQHGRLYLPAPGKPAVILTTRLGKGAQPVPVPSLGSAFVTGGPVSETGLAALKRTAVIR
jgi:hypothetical protein